MYTYDHLFVQITGEEEELHNDYETAQRRKHCYLVSPPITL